MARKNGFFGFLAGVFLNLGNLMTALKALGATILTYVCLIFLYLPAQLLADIAPKTSMVLYILAGVGSIFVWGAWFNAMMGKR